MCGGEKCEKDSFSGIRACMGIVAFLNWLVLRHVDSRFSPSVSNQNQKGATILGPFGPIPLDDDDDG